MDASLRPVRPREWAAVLDAVFHAHPSDEQTWLEWKSTLDLRSKEHIATIVSKAIIAFANRDPDEAAVTVGGIGILLIGIEPGSVPGVTPVDNADLDQMISLYVGADGPVWQPHWDQYQGKTILIIEVGPPRWGDRPHAFRKAFDPISDGQVYVRRKARSVPPDHKDVQRLADRYAVRAQGNGLEVAVGIDYPSQLPRWTWTEENVQSYVDGELDRLMEPLRKERARRAPPAGISAATGGWLADVGVMERVLPGLGGVTAESRSPAAYEAQVADYATRVRQGWPQAMFRAAASLIPPPVFKVTNLCDRNYHRLQVKLHVAGHADAVRCPLDNSKPDLRDLLPSEPRIWGTHYTPGLLGATSWPQARAFPDPLHLLPTDRSTRIERDGSFTLTFPAVDLRPHLTRDPGGGLGSAHTLVAHRSCARDMDSHCDQCRRDGKR